MNDAIRVLRRWYRRWSPVGVVAALVIGATLTGCSGCGQSSRAPAAQQRTGPGPAATSAPQPPQGQPTPAPGSPVAGVGGAAALGGGPPGAPAGGAAPAAPAAGSAPGLAMPPGAAGVATPSGASAPSPPPPGSAPLGVPGRAPRTDNLVALEMGGHVEYLSSRDIGDYARVRLLDGDPKTVWTLTGSNFPQEVVLSFLGHDEALVSGVTLTLPPPGPIPVYDKPNDAAWAKDIEVWTSMDGPTTGFRKVAAATLPKQPGDHDIAFPAPVRARYVKISITSNYGSPITSMLADVAVREGTAPGYVPFLRRHTDLASLLSSGVLPVDGSVAAPPPAPVAAPDACVAPVSTAGAPPTRRESRGVLVVASEPETYAPFAYATNHLPSPDIKYFPKAAGDGRVDSSIFQRASFLNVAPEAAAPALLVPGAGIDTVVLSQVCDVRTRVSDAFKRALVAWIGAGHKLLIQDADGCGPGKVPDYGFLPYAFGTSNPGAQGAASALRIVEQSPLFSPDPADPAFLDLDSWRQKINGNTSNDFGDSNTVVKFDSHWCGALVGANVKGANGFVLTYAHYGAGLILYDGVDRDQLNNVAYRQYVARQLLLPFAPDNLPCSTRLAPFAITTDAPLVSRVVLPGQTYTYPLSVVSVQPGYAGSVRLSLVGPPGLGDLNPRFDPPTVSLGSGDARSTLTITLPSRLPASWRMALRGAAADSDATLCVSARERRTGTLTVTAEAGPRAASPARKNLLFILDLSGSMNLPLGKSTRIGTARQVLHDVLKRVPDDFNVGLRLYGHRYGSRQKETCTDSELKVPVGPANRDQILKIVDSTRPRGETPLVYSVLQAIDDLKSAGGGSVVLVTDGEESCGGDFSGAASAVRQSGLDFRLDIVGFTLKEQRAREQLGSLAGSTGGAYYTAQDGPALTHALVAATISRFPYQVVDASGAVVARGEAGDPGQELPQGVYKVLVQAGDDQLSMDGVTVAVAGTVGVRVTRKGDRFALER